MFDEVGEQLQQRAQDGDQTASQMLQQFINDPRLNQVVSTANNVSQIDVDIILAKSPDYVTLRQEQFEAMAQLARSYGPEAVPFEVMLQLSEMPRKEEVMELLHPPEQVQKDATQQEAERQMAALLAELEVRDRETDIEKKEIEILERRAKVQKLTVDTEAQQIENEFFRATGFKDAEKLAVSGE